MITDNEGIVQSVRNGLKLVSQSSNETELITGILHQQLGALRANNGRLLDIGCGYGRFAAAIAPYVSECTLLDPHSEMLKEAGRKLSALQKQVELHCCRVEDILAFAKWRFDLILLSHVLYYIPDWRLVIERCHQWLNPNGSTDNRPLVTPL